MNTNWATPAYVPAASAMWECPGCRGIFDALEPVYSVLWAPGGVALWTSPPLCRACWERARNGMSETARAALAATTTEPAMLPGPPLGPAPDPTARR